MKKTYGLATAALLAVSLTACGGSDSGSSGDYCEQLKDTKEQFADFGEGNFDQASFEDLDNKIGELEDAAPEAVKDDWQVLGEGISGFLQVVEDAGITLDDIPALQRGEIPEGADPQKIQELPVKIQELGLDGPEFQNATKAIEQHAKSECGIDLNDESGTPSG